MFGRATIKLGVDPPSSLLTAFNGNWHDKRSNGPSLNSLMVDGERMRPGHWLWLMFCVPFSALRLLSTFPFLPL